MEEGQALYYIVLEGSANPRKCNISEGRFRLGVRKKNLLETKEWAALQSLFLQPLARQRSDSHVLGFLLVL